MSKAGNITQSAVQDYQQTVCYFDETTFTVSTSLSHHAPHNLVLKRPFARTNSYFDSFVPPTIFHWNRLDSSIVCAYKSEHLFIEDTRHAASVIYMQNIQTYCGFDNNTGLT